MQAGCQGFNSPYLQRKLRVASVKLQVMKVEKFEDLIVWQKAKDVCFEVYKLNCKAQYGMDVGFKDQIQRASISVMSNIAEGFEYGTNRNFVRYLRIAKGSAGEVRSLLAIGLEIGYLVKGECEKLIEKTVEVSKMIYGLIKSIE